MDTIQVARGHAGRSLQRLASRLRTAMTTGRQNDEQGQGLAEYALILALIAIVCIAALAFFGLQISAVLTDPVNRDFTGVISHITP
jgi:pilus assembly protein Flp/PilA